VHASGAPTGLRLSTDGNLITLDRPPAATATVPPVTVPNVVGLPQQQAEDTLRTARLSFTTNVESSTEAPDGQVLRQAPVPGTSVAPQSVVDLVISGEAPIVVPAVEGDWATVSAALEAAGFAAVQRSQWGVPYGQVVAVDPPAGTRWPRGAPVNVTVGSGTWLPLGVDFEDNIHLSGVDVATAEVRPGAVFRFEATWEATNTGLAEGTAPAPRPDYVVRGRLMDADGQVVAATEHVPVGGGRPTSSWQPGEIIHGDVFDLPVDATVPPGAYALWIDLYRSGDPNARLGIRQSSFGRTLDDRVEVLQVQVVADGT
jgi:hypothetical protein